MIAAVVLALAVVVALALLLSEDDGGPAVAPPVTDLKAPVAAPDVLPPPAPERPTEPAPEPQPLTGTVTGRIVHGDYRPVATADVAALEGGPLFLGFIMRDLPSLGARASTGDDGHFELLEVPATDRLILRLTGTDFAVTDAGPFTLRAGELLDLGNLLVEPGMRIRGVVNGPLGKPVPDAKVGLHYVPFISDWAIKDPRPSLVVFSDAEGLFDFTGARSGNFTLTVDTEDYAAGLHRGAVGGEHGNDVWVPINLREALTVSGVVVGTPGAVPLPGARVVAQPRQEALGAGADETVTDENGNFELTHMQPGSFGITGHYPGYRSLGVQLRVTEDTRVPLRLARNGSISGVVTTRDGRPAQHFDLQVYYLDRPVDRGGPVGDFRRFRSPDGAFMVDDLREGFYAVEAWAKDHALTRTEAVFLDQGENITGMMVQLDAGATLTGLVVDASGAPVAGAKVTTNLNQQSQVDFIRASIERRSDLRSTQSDADGRFALKGLTGDTYQLEVDHPLYAMFIRNDIVVRRGADVALDAPLVLERAGSIRGVAMDSTGASRSNVRVRLRSDWGYSTEVRSNGRGEYVFARLPPGTYNLFAISLKPDIGFSELMGQVLSETQNAHMDRIHLAPGQDVVFNVRLSY